MKKRMRKVALVMSLTIGLIIGSQSVMAVNAAEGAPISEGYVRSWVCVTCGNSLEVEPKRVVLSQTRWKCTDVNHSSVNCYVNRESYKDEYWVTCSHCNITLKQGESDVQYRTYHVSVD